MTIPARQFAWFRVAFGGYLAVHFMVLAPHAAELFGARGVLPDPHLNVLPLIFLNPLNFALPDEAVRWFLILLASLAMFLAAGVFRRTAAVLLWFGWACLFNRNNLISNPGLPYVGLMLLLCAILPLGEGMASYRRRADPAWRFPPAVYWALWIPLAAGYTYSGMHKLLFSPSWLNGEALRLLADNPLARPGPIREWIVGLPDWAIHPLTWFSLAGEILFLPLSCFRVGRALAWSWLVAMHLGILTVVAFADLTAGMLLAHFFTFDPAWRNLAWWPRWRRKSSASSSPGTSAAA